MRRFSDMSFFFPRGIRADRSLTCFPPSAFHGASGGPIRRSVSIFTLRNAMLACLRQFSSRARHLLCSEAVDDGQPILWHGRRAVHHQMGVRDTRMDRLDTIDGEDVAGRRTGKLIMRRASYQLAIANASTAVFLTKSAAFIGIGQQLAVIQRAFSAVTVFFTGHTGFQRAEAAQLTFNRDAHRTAPFRRLLQWLRRCIVVAGVLPSAFSEPSIIFELKPD